MGPARITAGSLAAAAVVAAEVITRQAATPLEDTRLEATAGASDWAKRVEVRRLIGVVRRRSQNACERVLRLSIRGLPRA